VSSRAQTSWLTPSQKCKARWKHLKRPRRLEQTH